MNNVVGQAVVGADLFGRADEVRALWHGLERGEHIHMLAPRRVGKTSLMLELRRKPQRNWHVAYVDVEGAVSPADCVAAIISELASTPSYRTWLEAMPLGRTMGNTWHGLRGAEVSAPFLRVELRSAMGNSWPDTMDRLQMRLGRLPEGDEHLLIIVDELPVLIARMLRQDHGRDQVELLLAKLRGWRQWPPLRGKVHTLIGGSVGLDGILRQEGLSALINDLVPFPLESWDRPTAARFLKQLGQDHDFHIEDEGILQMLDLLQDPVPYHVQLFFHELYSEVEGESSALTAGHIDRCFAERLAGARGTAHLDHYGTRLETALDEESYATAQAVLTLACGTGGAAMADVAAMAKGREGVVPAVLNSLEFEGYLRRRGDRVVFRSNLLRTWWRKQLMHVEA